MTQQIILQIIGADVQVWYNKSFWWHDAYRHGQYRYWR